jgi:hypothetical protein
MGKEQGESDLRGGALDDHGSELLDRILAREALTVDVFLPMAIELARERGQIKPLDTKDTKPSSGIAFSW